MKFRRDIKMLIHSHTWLSVLPREHAALRQLVSALLSFDVIQQLFAALTHAAMSCRAHITYLSSVGPAEGIARPHHILDPLHLLLVALPVLHGSLLRLLQRPLQRLNSLGCRPKTLLQFGKFTAKVGVVAYQLWHGARRGVTIAVRPTCSSKWIEQKPCEGLAWS